MRSALISLLLLCCSLRIAAQTPPKQRLEEVVVIPQSADDYVWERAALIRGRILFNNAIAATEETVYSFGGFNTVQVQRELNRLESGRLVKDTLRYPGPGFMNNLFFVRDSFLYIGGGHDSGRSHYTYTDFWQYNRQTGAWKRLADLPFLHLHPLHVFPEAGRIVVLVPQLYGDGLKAAAPLLYAYHPDVDTWQLLSPQLPPPRLSGSAENRWAASSLWPVSFHIADDIYVLFQSPCLTDASCANSFYKFHLPSQTWTELPPFPGKTLLLSHAFALSDETYGYLGGGRGSRNAGNSREVFRYDPVTGKWERIADIPLGVRYAKGWMYGGEKYVGFGMNDRAQTVAVWRLRLRKGRR